ncbi:MULTISPECIES: S8 family peptidase [Priestia]|uniref:Peptidase families S8 and S53 n=1 Tax=Priestia megaterium (strain ATCC 12872 / QMB1551) TaxID=545693 RepID=D5E4I6_PRIM1|nr:MULTISPECIES: S8 family serine peptidase [Priestia]ADE72711.1 peptidase families S8 and S53 [Priestia megaterium QM B1551]MBG9930925.1 hypothetical protein [Priestia aryabhattai]
MRSVKIKFIGLGIIIIILIGLCYSFMYSKELKVDKQVTKEEKKLSNENWYFSYLGFDKNHYTGKHVKVGVIDTNIDTTLQKKVEKYVSLTPITKEEAHLHGSKMLEVLYNVAPSADVYHYGISPSDEDVRPDFLVKAFKAALNENVSIINISLNFKKEIPALTPLLEKAHKQGVTVITSTGNEGLNTVNFPAGSSYTIAVNSVEKDGVIADYSNYGINVDFSLPGSATIDGKEEYGTSVSAILLTGMVARIMEKSDKNLNSDEIMRILQKMSGNKQKTLIVGYGTPKIN